MKYDHVNTTLFWTVRTLVPQFGLTLELNGVSIQSSSVIPNWGDQIGLLVFCVSEETHKPCSCFVCFLRQFAEPQTKHREHEDDAWKKTDRALVSQLVLTLKLGSVSIFNTLSEHQGALGRCLWNHFSMTRESLL